MGAASVAGLLARLGGYRTIPGSSQWSPALLCSQAPSQQGPKPGLVCSRSSLTARGKRGWRAGPAVRAEPAGGEMICLWLHFALLGLRRRGGNIWDLLCSVSPCDCTSESSHTGWKWGRIMSPHTGQVPAASGSSGPADQNPHCDMGIPAAAGAVSGPCRSCVQGLVLLQQLSSSLGSRNRR